MNNIQEQDRNNLLKEPKNQESEWDYGNLTFDELRNIIEVCDVKDAKMKLNCLTISFVPKDATGDIWEHLKEKMLQVGSQ